MSLTVDLQSHLGADGLTLLLAYLSAGPGRTAEPGVAVADIDSFADLVRPCRLRITSRHGAVLPNLASPPSCDVRTAWTPYQSSALRRLLDPSATG